MTEKIVNIIREEPFVGEDGLDYVKITKEILTPRKTFLKGTIQGKYRGDKIPDVSDKSDLYDFEIYEAEVCCNSIDDFSKNKPFTFPHDFKNITNCNKIKGTVFPKEKLPSTLPVIISAHNKSFGFNVLEPQLFEFALNRKEHQIEGDEVFGTFSAFITGFVFDYEKEEIEEVVGPIYHEEIDITDISDPPLIESCKSNGVKTGKTETKNGYIRHEYYCKRHSDKVWGPWLNQPTKPGTGCFSEIISVIGIVLFIAFLLAILPGLVYFIGFYIAILLLGILAPYLKWIIRLLGILLLIGFIGSMLRTCSHSNGSSQPIPSVVDPGETKPPVIPEVDRTPLNPVVDKWITRYRKWSDYDGNEYEGYYKIRMSSFNKSHFYKNNLGLSQSNIQNYDEIVYNLKENDKNELSYVYPLFDSIGKSNKLDRITFAKMLVTFVQDIPYALVLDNSCDPNLYGDSFTRSYLSSGKGDCDGNQRFGINTPVEFLVNLKGDCDTRTLLLYTLFSHYDYDVALLSSEFYGHSIIGVNLPIEGAYYSYNNRRYVLWETTAANAKPGQISNEISNLNNWRISLKSK